MSEKPLILGINGSPHQDGIVAELLGITLTAAENAGATTEIIHLYDLTSIHTQGLYSESPELETIKNIPKDDITALFPKIIKADGLVFATPVYWSDMSAVMKDFIEHLTPLENDGFLLNGKVAVFIAASKENEGGLEMAAMSMVGPLAQMGVLIPPNGVMWYPGHWSTAEGEHNGWAKEWAPTVGRSMTELIMLLKKHPIQWLDTK